jgi:hypothetical protein
VSIRDPCRPLVLQRQAGPADAVPVHHHSTRRLRHLRLEGIAAVKDRASDRGPGEAGRTLGQTGAETGHIVVAGRSPGPAGHIEAGPGRAGPVIPIR